MQLNLAGATDEVPTGALIRTVKMEVMAALEELRVITTHDDNLEKQYRESKTSSTVNYAYVWVIITTCYSYDCSCS